MILAVLVATLTPNPSNETASWVLCTICGPRGIADALLNIILFTPVGLALVLTGTPLRRSILIGAMLSLGIELAQIVIPGRDPSVGDVIMNTVGAALGAWLPARSQAWLRPTDKTASWFSLAAASLVTLGILTTGILLQTSYTTDDYYGFWTPQLGHIEWYRGQVLDARIGGIPFTNGKLGESARIRELLLAGTPFDVKAIAGPPVARLGGLVAIADGHKRFNLLVGPDRDDLVFEHRTISEVLGLEQPDLRLPGAMKSISPGDTLTFRLWKPDRYFCIQLNAIRQCDMGYGPGAGWRILFSGDDLPFWIRDLVTFGWIAALVAPVAYWARASWPSACAAAVLLAGFIVVTPWSGLLPLDAVGWLALAAGALGGWGIRRGMDRLAR